VRRREFITLLGGAAAWPLAARAQPRERMRRVAVVMQFVENDWQGQLRAAAFRDGLEKAGWVAGRNIAVDYLWGALDSERTRGITEQLRQRVPDAIAINSSRNLREIEFGGSGSADHIHRDKRAGGGGFCGEPRASRRQHNGFLEILGSSHNDLLVSASSRTGACPRALSD
jgi:hypothetical protein